MQGQRPSLSQFLNNPSSSKPRPNNSSSSNNPLHPLPQTQQPTSSNPVAFYKTRQRLSSSMFSTRIGYRIRLYTRVQQDFIFYLTQLIAMECPAIKVYVIEPNYLYFQVGKISEQGEQVIDKEKERQEVELENRMFGFLRLISEQIFNGWANVNLAPDRLVSQDFTQDKLIHAFNQQVIEKIKQKHGQMFGRANNKRDSKK